MITFRGKEIKEMSMENIMITSPNPSWWSPYKQYECVGTIYMVNGEVATKEDVDDLKRQFDEEYLNEYSK